MIWTMCFWFRCDQVVPTIVVSYCMILGDIAKGWGGQQNDPASLSL